MIDLKQLTPICDIDSIVYASCATGLDDEGNEVERYAMANAKHMMKKILSHFDTDTHGYRAFLGGSGNFRKEVATILPYKGTRPEKPKCYDVVRDYLCDIWQAELVNGMEAEDMACIVYNEDPEHSVVVHIDKDIDQLPGHHFNYKHEKYYYVSPKQANYNLWKQILCGDRIDTILGIPKVGSKKAEEILNGISTYRDGWNRCKEAYFQAFGQQRCELMDTPKGARWTYTKGEGLVTHDGKVLSYKEALLENARLVYLLRTENDQFKELE